VVLHEQVDSPFFEDPSLLSDDIVLSGGWFQNNKYQPISTFVGIPNYAYVIFCFILFVLLIIFGCGYVKFSSYLKSDCQIYIQHSHIILFRKMTCFGLRDHHQAVITNSKNKLQYSTN
jgi:hypothetical protein